MGKYSGPCGMKTVLQREAGHGQWSSSQTRSMCAGGDTAFSVRVTLGCAVFLSKKKHVNNSHSWCNICTFSMFQIMPVLNPIYCLVFVWCANISALKHYWRLFEVGKNIFHLILILTRYKYLRSTKYQDYLWYLRCPCLYFLPDLGPDQLCESSRRNLDPRRIDNFVSARQLRISLLTDWPLRPAHRPAPPITKTKQSRIFSFQGH